MTIHGHCHGNVPEVAVLVLILQKVKLVRPSEGVLGSCHALEPAAHVHLQFRGLGTCSVSALPNAVRMREGGRSGPRSGEAQLQRHLPPVCLGLERAPPSLG